MEPLIQVIDVDFAAVLVGEVCALLMAEARGAGEALGAGAD